MLDKLGCFAMGFVFAIVLGLVNATVRAAEVDSAPPIHTESEMTDAGSTDGSEPV